MKSHLPHFYDGHNCFYITFRLADLLPQSVVSELKNSLQAEIDLITEKNDNKRKLIIDELRMKYFKKYEHQLDSKPYGDCVLKDPEIAQLLYDKMLSYHDLHYTLHCFLYHAQSRPCTFIYTR